MNLEVSSFLSALGVVVYIILVALFMNNANKMFGSDNDISGPLTLLLLFVFSAGLTGALVLGKPILMYLEGQKKESVKLFALNLAWIFLFLVIALLAIVLKSL